MFLAGKIYEGRQERKSKMFSYKRRAQYHETDQMGIIHHANYVKWMEEARVRFMDVLGLGYREMESLGIQSPVADVSLSYKKSVCFDDEVEVRISIKKYNSMVLELGYEFTDLTSGTFCTEASSRHCFVKDGKLISLKKVLPELDKRIRENMERSERC